MELKRELLLKAKEAKTAQELAAFAKENGVELSAEQAKKLFADLRRTGELADEELENVSGGSCNPYGDECPKCGCTKVCQNVTQWQGKTVYAWCCANCGDYIAPI